jgi:hypothetical protein
MRKREPIKIDKKEITVKELTVREILEIAELKNVRKGADLSLAMFKKEFSNYLPRAVEGIKVDDLLDMAPSELKQIYDKFKEVNATFFDVARSVGLGELLDQIKTAIQRDFLKLLAG